MLALYALKNFMKAKMEEKVLKIMCNAFFAWMLADIVSAIGEFALLVNHFNIERFFQIEIILYLGVRLFVLASILQYYYCITKKVNRFQVISDIITLLNCISLTIWLVYFRGRTYALFDEQTALFLHGDKWAIFSLVYLIISLFDLGGLLIIWFYIQRKSITLGQRFVLFGIFMMAGVDLVSAFDYTLIYSKVLTDVLYKCCLLCIAIGGVFYDSFSFHFPVIKDNEDKGGSRWKNALYLLTYPVLVITLIGFQVTVLFYILIIVFYITSCLYVKQIARTDQLLDVEKKIMKKLRDQYYFTSQLLDTIPSAIFYTSVEDVFLGANAEYRKVYGMVSEELIGRKINEVPWMTEENYQIYQSMKCENMKCNLSSTRQIKRKCIDGRVVTVLYSISKFYLTEGSLGGYLGVMTDISELKQKEKELEKAVKEANEATELVQAVSIVALASLAKTRDQETGFHLERTKRFVRALSEELAANSSYQEFLDASTIDMIVAAAPLHDIGKVGIPDAILQKPGKLTQEEFEIMKTHTTLGYEAIDRAEALMGRQNTFLRFPKEITYSHHEKWNGSGYPQGLSGCDIPLSARIVALADVYDAIRSERVYKKSFTHKEAMEIIKQEAGEQFDPLIVAAFLRRKEEFEEISLRYQE